MTKCKTCGDEIKFIKTKTGAYMPVNATPVGYTVDINGKNTIITQDGSVLARMTLTEENPLGIGYIPHWATCKRPDPFRKQKQMTFLEDKND